MIYVARILFMGTGVLVPIWHKMDKIPERIRDIEFAILRCSPRAIHVRSDTVPGLAARQSRY